MKTLTKSIFYAGCVTAMLNGAAVGAQIALVPVGATGIHTIVGNEIILNSGGGTVELEIRIAGWDPQLLASYELLVNAAGFSSGSAGFLSLPTTPRNQCASSHVFIDETRSDFVFVAGMPFVCALFDPDPLIGIEPWYLGVALDASGFFSEVTDPGVERYAGTLKLDVSPNAAGTFTLEFLSTFLVNDSGLDILPVTLTPALITVASLPAVCATDSDCDDGLFCNGMESCVGGTCQAGTPVDCNDGDTCTTDRCDSSSGLCANAPVSCDDGVTCTDDFCDPGTGSCSHIANNTNCPDDGWFCNGTESCDPMNDCVSSGDPCPANTVCNEATDACDMQMTGQGFILSRNPDFSTDDRTFNASETLYMLVWTDVIDFNDLKKAQWELKSGDRVKQNLTNMFDITYTAAYDLSNRPNSNTSWQWKAKVEDNAGNKFQPTDNIIVLDAPACSGPGDCEDSDACTDDECVAGSCTNTPIDCNDGNVCTDDSCTPGSGCVNTNNTDPCDDGDACTSGDVCSGGACAGGSSTNCNDGNVCTDDSCTPGSGCVNTNNADPCDDGDVCTSGDTCAGGACVGGPPPDCDDLDPCTADSCDPGTGLCVYDPIIPCCGDGFCDPGEDRCNCPADCGAPPTTETNCTNSIDEDCDGDTDCADSDCAAEPACSAPTTGEGFILSKSADFSTDDRTFNRTDTLYILVWTDVVDFNDIRKKQWELKDPNKKKVKQNLTNHFDITYTAQIDLSSLPSSSMTWTFKATVQDNAGNQFKSAASIALMP